ncbi:hypothetical protein TTHERM_002653465, partial (macronuclear) [Tetrahymena thermophila SB210]
VTYTLMAFLLIFHDLTTHYARFPFVFQIFCSEWGLLFTTYQIWPFPPTKETAGNIHIFTWNFSKQKGRYRIRTPDITAKTLRLAHSSRLALLQIGDQGASGLGTGLANCTNLSNLILYLG